MPLADKLVRWACLGLQGALLSNYIEPIYYEKVIVPTYKRTKGILNCLENCARSLNVYANIELPEIFALRTMKKKKMAEISTQITIANGPEVERPCCTCWVRGGVREQIFYDSGSTCGGNVSQLCKSSLFDLFAGLTFDRKLRVLNTSEFSPVYPLNYRTVKAQAAGYENLKQKLCKKANAYLAQKKLNSDFSCSCISLADNFSTQRI